MLADMKAQIVQRILISRHCIDENEFEFVQLTSPKVLYSHSAIVAYNFGYTTSTHSFIHSGYFYGAS